jgi:uncharacterized protein (TIGR02646 family)
MRKIEKNGTLSPKSLQTKTTIEKISKLIRAKKWIKDKVFEDRYRVKDIKKELESLYHHKCAYCERKIKGNSEIEHYRPKIIYYWMAYSWDNLMLCCKNCNTRKSNQFPVKNSILMQETIDYKLNNAELNKIEEPLLVNPEIDDINASMITYNINCEISSEDERLSKTIEICDLNNKELIIQRKTIYESLFFELSTKKDDQAKKTLKDFLENAKNPEIDHSMFRSKIPFLIIKELSELRKK